MVCVRLPVMRAICSRRAICYTLRHIPEIIPLGISALKIEGRYKDADYVALTTAAYRKAVDEAWAGQPLSISPREELQLEQVYSRGLGAYFISGTNHQQVVKGRSPRHRGVMVGRVARIVGEGVLVDLAPTTSLAPIKPGDGLVFDAADWRSPQEPEEGGRVYTVRQARRGPDGVALCQWRAELHTDSARRPGVA